MSQSVNNLSVNWTIITKPTSQERFREFDYNADRGFVNQDGAAADISVNNSRFRELRIYFRRKEETILCQQPGN